MELEFKTAKREAVPQMISLASVSGGGKTYSALLLAAGLAGPDGKVGMVDTENGRGQMYADSPGIVKALPKGYLYARFDPPYTPERYIEYMKACEEAGVTVGVVDSGTHEWEGIGGVAEEAEQEEKSKGRFGKWASPKMRHKRFVYHILSSKIHWIFCLRAREKAKFIRRGDPIILGPGQETSDARIATQDTVIQLGLQPIAEKNFAFEMTLSLVLDEKTHFAAPIKIPEPLASVFPDKHLITVDDGVRIAQWNATGATFDPFERTRQRARATAEEGSASYKAMYDTLKPIEKKKLQDLGDHAANKVTAAQVDKDRTVDQSQSAGGVRVVNELPDAIECTVGTKMSCNGKVSEVWDDGEMHRWMDV